MAQSELFVIEAFITNEEAALGTATNYARSVSPPESTTSLRGEQSLNDPNIVTFNINTFRVPDIKHSYRVAVPVTAVAEHPGADNPGVQFNAHRNIKEIMMKIIT